MKNSSIIYFTRAERKSLFVFFLMASLFITMMYAMYRFEKTKVVPFEKAVTQSMGAQAAEHHIRSKIRIIERKQKSIVTTQVFQFDPNSISEDSLKMLGIDAKTSRIFLKYRSKGAKFKSKEQFYKVYGMQKYQSRLDSLLVFNSGESKKEAADVRAFADNKMPENKETAIPTVKIRIIQINEADSFEWQLIKGIGEKLAGRIVRYRERLGGFVAIEQLEEVYGLRPETFLAISHLLSVDEGQVTKLRINESTESQLSGHPYIGKKKAMILSRYIKNRGQLHALTDLVASKLFDEEEIRKLEPYLDFSK
ncbi:MAG: helix-hairpin-helix domain-containing protein [Saprospiraceae bacterium]|nr:helix-hairpin-helix domain-containing protein [Saprospiraceae bacterium]